MPHKNDIKFVKTERRNDRTASPYRVGDEGEAQANGRKTYRGKTDVLGGGCTGVTRGERDRDGGRRGRVYGGVLDGSRYVSEWR